ncbi:MAG TPA: peroxide stress protein YaaA [Baekduia sp.]|nr:peroxide stress protein YaaA [Baekduia sp.]
MLILLPPSEGKTAPAHGPELDLQALAFPELTALRERLLDNLARLSTRRTPTALKALKISVGQVDEVQRNGSLRSAATAPAHEVYTGVLYERLRLGEFSAEARAQVLIASALWGMVRADDLIPAYRLSIGAQLPRVGALAAYWRPALLKAVPEQDLTVDLRSGGYAAAWTPRAATVVTVRGFVEKNRRRSIVSHMVKATRGEVARILLELPAPPADASEVAAAVERAGHRVELTPAGSGWSVDVVE